MKCEVYQCLGYLLLYTYFFVSVFAHAHDQVNHAHAQHLVEETLVVGQKRNGQDRIAPNDAREPRISDLDNESY